MSLPHLASPVYICVFFRLPCAPRHHHHQARAKVQAKVAATTVAEEAEPEEPVELPAPPGQVDPTRTSMPDEELAALLMKDEERAEAHHKAEGKKDEALHHSHARNAPKGPAEDPDAWVEQYDPNAGMNYYYNTTSGTSQWNKPEGFKPGAKSDEMEAATKMQGLFRVKKVCVHVLVVLVPPAASYSCRAIASGSSQGRAEAQTKHWQQCRCSRCSSYSRCSRCTCSVS